MIALHVLAAIILTAATAAAVALCVGVAAEMWAMARGNNMSDTEER